MPRVSTSALILACTSLLWAVTPALAQTQTGTLRAVLVGVDSYAAFPALRGAVADMADLETVLKARGAADVTRLTDKAATRKAVGSALDAVVSRTKSGDTVVIAFSGVGADEPATGAGATGQEVVLLQNFAPEAGARAAEKITAGEVLGQAARLEAQGAQVIVIRDVATGSAMLRAADSRSELQGYRSARYTLPPGKPAASMPAPDPASLTKTLVLAAAPRGQNVVEVQIPGEGPRGALSYAVARGLEGAADFNRDGAVSPAELADYVARVSYQVAEQRQTAVAEMAAPKTRGISVRPVGPAANSAAPGIQAPSAPSALPAPSVPAPTPAAVSGGLTIRPVIDPPTAAPTAPATKPPGAPTGGIRIATLDGQGARIAGFVIPTPYEVVPANASPDLVWDPASREVISAGDVIARNIDRLDLPGVIERAATVRGLKTRITRAPQPIRITPDDRLHHKGERIEIEIAGVANRSLVLFNITGDGSVQLLYPIGSDSGIVQRDVYKLQLQVSEPFGADQVVAVTSGFRLSELEAAVRQLERRKTPSRILDLLDRLPGSDVAVGSAGLFTAP